MDKILIQHIEEMSDGQSIHLALNLVAGYTAAVEEWRAGDERFRSIALEAERQLRVLLCELRLKRGLGWMTGPV